MARTEDFEVYVGQRSTVHIWSMPAQLGGLMYNSKRAGKALRHTQGLLAEFAHQASNATLLYISSVLSARAALRMASAGELPLGRLRLVHPERVLELCEFIGLRCSEDLWPTTGILAAYLAIVSCSAPPKLYGFDLHSVPAYYYDPPDTLCDAKAGMRVGALKGSAHDGPAEQAALRRWQDLGKVELAHGFSPKPDLSQCTIPNALRFKGPPAAYPIFVGLWEAQDYAINGRVVYERKPDPNIEGDDYWVLFFTMCKLDEQSGIWIVTGSEILAAQRDPEYRGSASICKMTAYSLDFRPERPFAGVWKVLWGGQPVLDENFRFESADSK